MPVIFTARQQGQEEMRACFLGQNVCALGFGVATLQTPPLMMDEETGEPADLAPPDSGQKPSSRTEPTPRLAGFRPL